MSELANVQLNPNEQIVGIIRRSLLAEMWRIVLAILWLLLPFFFFFPLLQLGPFGLTVFVGVLAGAVWYALRWHLRWKYTVLIITEQRIIDVEQSGLFNRQITELNFTDVSDVVIQHQSWLGRLFDIGIVRIQTIQAMHFDFELSGVRHPEHIREFIVEVQYMTEKYVDNTKAHQIRG